MAAFDQMEEKVLQQEARSESGLPNCAGADLEVSSASLEGGSGRGRRTAALKKSPGKAAPRPCPCSSADPPPRFSNRFKVAEVNAELEELKRSIDKL